MAQVEEPAGDVGAPVDDGEGEDVGGGGGVVGGGEFGVEVGAGAGDGGDRGGDEVGGGGMEEFEELGACVIIFSSVWFFGVEGSLLGVRSCRCRGRGKVRGAWGLLLLR